MPDRIDVTPSGPLGHSPIEVEEFGELAPLTPLKGEGSPPAFAAKT